MAFDGYLKIEGIKGEAHDMEHKDWIQLHSFSHAVQNETTGHSGGGAHTGGRCHHGDINITKPLDGSSPNLMLACCQGKSHKKATIELCRSGASGPDKIPYQVIELSDVVVTSVSPQASSGDDFPTESVSITYSTITWKYTQTDLDGAPKGEVVTGWDLKQNITI